MADGGSNKGKFVAGCSCLSVVFFLFLIMFIQFGLSIVVEQVPDIAVAASVISGVGAYISYSCCCLSGVGMVIGIVMLAMGGKKEAEA
jgi:hypothetical protein